VNVSGPLTNLPAQSRLRAVVMVSNLAGASSSKSSPVFFVDKVLPMCRDSAACACPVSVRYPARVLEQASMPGAASGVLLRVGLDPVLSGSPLSACNWSLFRIASGSDVAAGTGIAAAVSTVSGSQYCDVPLPPATTNGTTFRVSFRCDGGLEGLELAASLRPVSCTDSDRLLTPQSRPPPPIPSAVCNAVCFSSESPVSV
jgi:hypothetical protein